METLTGICIVLILIVIFLPKVFPDLIKIRNLEEFLVLARKHKKKKIIINPVIVEKPDGVYSFLTLNSRGFPDIMARILEKKVPLVYKSTEAEARERISVSIVIDAINVKTKLQKRGFDVQILSVVGNGVLDLDSEIAFVKRAKYLGIL